MKMRIVLVLLLCMASVANAGYDYVISSGYGSWSLNNYETLLMTGGGGHSLTLEDYSYARIENTSPLVQYSGGIWLLRVAGYSHLDFLGGGVHQFDIGSYGTATLSGGRLDEIWSYQFAWKYVGWEPQVLVPDPHIEVICREWDYDTLTKKLTGIWNIDNNNDGQFDTFNIQLVNVSGCSPTIENIKFTIIPEPITLMLLGLGGLLIRRRR